MTARADAAVRRCLAAASVLLAVAGCSGPTSPGAGSSPAPARTGKASALLGADRGAVLAAPVLVAGRHGVSVFTPVGPIRELVNGPVAIAVDDLRGGLLYQRGRGPVDAGGTAGPTAIEWMARDSRIPTVLVTPPPGGSLALHDAVDLDGEVTVFYTRFEGGVGHLDTVDTLERTGAANGRTNEVRRVGGFEESRVLSARTATPHAPIWRSSRPTPPRSPTSRRAGTVRGT